MNIKNFKKSEIAIYAISLMLVAAGYFNFMTFDKNKTYETYSEDIENINEEYANVGDAVLVSNSELEEGEQEDKELINEEANDVDNTSANIENNENYYAESKIDREKMYAEMISSYEEILNNTNVTEVQKSIATQEITKINEAKNAIMICENLIQTKGFTECIVFINGDSVNVVVSVENGLNIDKVAIIQNIISRELHTEIKNIHITEK